MDTAGNKWQEIVRAFTMGGYVTVYEADAYLRLRRGSTKRAALAGKIQFSTERRGTSLRLTVRAQDAERVLGVATK